MSEEFDIQIKRNEKFFIIYDYIKDISFEIPNTDAFINAQHNLDKYATTIDIKSLPLTNPLIEINIRLILQAPLNLLNKIHSEVCLAIIVKIYPDPSLSKDEVQRLILVDIPNLYSEKISNIITNLFQQSGFKNFSFKQKLDFIKFYEEKRLQTSPLYKKD